MNDSLTVEEITPEESRVRFDQACETLLGISGPEFERRIDSSDYSGLDRSAAMRVAMIRPSRKPA